MENQNIYALKGFKVKILDIYDGMHNSKAFTERYLKVGEIYTVERTVVDDWHTEYYFQQCPEIGFSNFDCEELTVQSEEDNKKHPDWAKYNS